MANKARKKRLRDGARAAGGMTATVADTAFQVVSHGIPPVSSRADEEIITPEKADAILYSPVARDARRRASEAERKGFLDAGDGLHIPTGGSPDGRDQSYMTILLMPGQAATLSGRYSGGRPAGVNAVRRMVKSMEDDRFPRTHQTLAIDIDGNMLDGGHRCRAIVRSDKPVLIDIAYNCAPYVVKYTDLGRKRSLGDIIALSPCGFTHCKMVGSMLKEAAEGVSVSGRCRIPDEKTVRLAEANAEQIKWIFQHCPPKRGMRAGFYGAVLRATLAMWDDEEKLSRIAEFCALFHKSSHTGAGGCPLNKLLQYMQSPKNYLRRGQTSVPSKDEHLRTAHALNLFVSGKSLKTWSSLPKGDIWPFDCEPTEVEDDSLVAVAG